MACLVVLLAFISPRLALFAIFLFSDLLSRAFDSWFVPLLGFFLLPWTTLAYAVMWSASSNQVTGFEWFIVILAFVIDLGSYANRGRVRRDYRLCSALPNKVDTPSARSGRRPGSGAWRGRGRAPRPPCRRPAR